MSTATITYRKTRHELDGSQPFTFGRADECTLCLDPEDLGISRLAGSVEHAAGTWWLVNCSGSRTLVTVSEYGFRSLVEPGRKVALDGRTSVFVDGANTRHALVVTAPPPSLGDGDRPTPSGLPTTAGGGVVINERDRLALVALFVEYLEDPPRRDPAPKSYEAAAFRLDWPRTSLVKRIEYLRARLTKAGVPNLSGPAALASLAEYVITGRIITRDDLALLRNPRSHA